MRSLKPAAIGLAATLIAMGAHAQSATGENYSAGKTPAQLFSSDCSDSGCHSRPQGLAKGRSATELTAYLRAHYTNSQQSAVLLAGYLQGVGGSAPSDARTARTGRSGAARPEPPERVVAPERTERSGRDWLPNPLSSLFGRNDAERPPAEIETPPPPASSRARQPTRQPQQSEQPARPAAGSDARSARQETPPRSEQEGSLLAPLRSLFGREEAEKPAVQVQPPKPSRSRQSSRQPPKTEQAAKPATETVKPATETGAPPAETQTASPPRTRQSSRQPPKTEQAAKPPVEAETRPAPVRQQRATRQPPRTEESAKPPAVTGTVPARPRRAPLVPSTEDNTGPPSASDIFRPARRGSGDGTDVVIPDEAAGARRSPIFD